MNKYFLVSISLLLVAMAVKAQLIVNYDYKVGIGTETESFNPTLMVGDHSYFGIANTSIGVAGSPEEGNMDNIGIYGRTSEDSSHPFDKNYGVLGLVDITNTTHGNNYGLSGMISNTGGSNCGGAGIYGTCYDYYFLSPANITGYYAGYFSGNVHVTNNLSSLAMFTTADSRLAENVVSLSNRDGSRSGTLENLLNLNVIEYNQKSRLEEFNAGDADAEKEAELRREYEYLKQEDTKMASRRHYGIDARELQAVYPGLVLEEGDGSLSVSYLEMVPLLIQSVQELKQELDEVKAAD